MSGNQNNGYLNVRRKRLLWEKDGINDGPSSNDLVVSWLLKNYARWKGANSVQKEKKETLCSEIREELEKHGITHRTNRDIRTRVNQMQESFREAEKWISTSSKGLRQKMERDNCSPAEITRKIEEEVKKRFIYYYDFEALMGDNACATPPYVKSSEDDIGEQRPIHYSDSDSDVLDELEDYDSPAPTTTKEKYTPAPTSPATMTVYEQQYPNTKRRRSVSLNIENYLRATEERARAMDEKKLKLEEEGFRWKQEVEERRLKIEETNAQVAKMHAQVAKIHAQVAAAQMWRSLGLSNDDVVQKISDL